MTDFLPTILIQRTPDGKPRVRAKNMAATNLDAVDETERLLLDALEAIRSEKLRSALISNPELILRG